MGGVQSAYGALQDRLKGEFLGRFARTYAAIHGEPLRLGTRSIVSAERHVGFVDPAARERLRKEEAKLVETLRARVQGKYSYGSVKDKLDRLLQEQEIARQNQIGMFGSLTSGVADVRLLPLRA